MTIFADFASWHLEWPWVWYLLPLPWLGRTLMPVFTPSEQPLWVPFFDQAQIAATDSNLTMTRSKHFLTTRGLLASTVWLCLLAAASRPVFLGDAIANPHSGRDLMLAVDISRSMETMDLQWQGTSVNRLQVVKAVVGEFVQRRHTDRLGLILFGEHAYVHVPLTFDRKTVQRLLYEAQIGFAGNNTAIGEAIGAAIKRLKNQPQHSRVLILLTDGANTAGEVSPRQAADLAKQTGIKIYAIGIGSDHMKQLSLFGTVNHNPSKDLDEAMLKHLAEVTGGRYFRARSTADLTHIYRVLDELEPIAVDAPSHCPRYQMFYWPLGVAFLLSLLMSFQVFHPRRRYAL